MGALDFAHPAVRTWFTRSFEEPTSAQAKGWPAIASGRSTLLLAPTGSGKTLAAFLCAIDRLMFGREPEKRHRLRVLYISPLKALGVDVERNLRGPLAGIRSVAERDGHSHREVLVAVRSGDTPSGERSRMVRNPPDILITTPESLYLLLTSSARDILPCVDVVIVDEIHAMVASKRGAHLFTSLERLEALRGPDRPPLQRIGLSATQRPLDEVARLLGGGEVSDDGLWKPRPVEIVDAGRKRSLDLTIEVPVEDMANLPTYGSADHISDDDDESSSFESPSVGSGAAAMGGSGPSIWPAIHPRLVELIRAHRSTMVFVNSRRTAERLAAAINDVAGEEIALAHHGSLAKDRRTLVEDRLKRGDLPAIVATSSLELGIDMGAVDLVIQIEAPPSVASGLQRVGRAGHQVGGVSKGVMFPKYRGDLLAAAAALVRMREGQVEATYYPRNPLDVLAQQIVAMVAMDTVVVDEVYRLLRGAAPFAELPRGSFDGVLDMLSGLYPSEQFSELRPRVTYDRVAGTLQARAGAQRIAVINGGTIPDRGLYGVFLADGHDQGSKRVGELDEEMVFESRPGDVFLLGASSWRIEDITHDRVLVIPAPGEPGRMPFWHGDRPGRPLEFGRAIGALTRDLAKKPKDAADAALQAVGLDAKAARNLVAYLTEQQEATDDLPTDRTIVFETFVDEIGDHRVCILSPFGARVHAPWATAVVGRLREETTGEVDMLYSDDGIVFRLPEADSAPNIEPFFPRADEVEPLVVQSLADTSLFAARFRENAARALLLPKRRPGQRTPLWAQRRRSADLLAVASQFESFPMMLETYRECLKDVFDLPGLLDVLKQVETRKIRVVGVASKRPSPFANSLLFTYVANFMYEGDAPLAERRAQALSIDHAQLRELLGEAELRELLDPDAIDELERRLQRIGLDRGVKHADGLHDLLLALGDLSRAEIAQRAPAGDVDAWIEALKHARRIIEINIAGDRRWAAAEDAAKLRDALGVMPPPGLPDAFLVPQPEPLMALVARYARTHGPFTAAAIAERYRLSPAVVSGTLARLAADDRLLSGEFIPGGRGEEWCDPEVLRSLKRMSLAKLRRQVEPVEASALGRFVPLWHGLARPRAGLDALLTVIEQLQGTPLVASVLETEILPTRIKNYTPSDLDELFVAGEVRWRGLEPIGPHDGRVALYLTDHYSTLAPPIDTVDDDLAGQILERLETKGALLFSDLQRDLQVFPQDIADALWTLVWAGRISNDTLAPVRTKVAAAASQLRRGTRHASRHASRGRSFRSRRSVLPGTQGRWSLLPDPMVAGPSETERRTALTHQLLERHGVLTREAVAAEGVAGAFSTVYPVLKALEEAGRVRRGYFVSGLGATQFALPGAEDRLRSLREPNDEDAEPLVIAATDPANPYGAVLPWPSREGARPQRAAGSQVVLFHGELLAYIGRSEKTVTTFLPEHEPERSDRARRLAEALARLAERGRRAAVMFSQIDGEEPQKSVLGPYLTELGFSTSSRGMLKRGAHA